MNKIVRFALLRTEKDYFPLISGSHADYTLSCPSSSVCSHQGQKYILLR